MLKIKVTAIKKDGSETILHLGGNHTEFKEWLEVKEPTVESVHNLITTIIISDQESINNNLYIVKVRLKTESNDSLTILTIPREIVSKILYKDEFIYRIPDRAVDILGLPSE